MSSLTAYHESGHATVAYLLGGSCVDLAVGNDETLPADDVLPEHYGHCRIQWPDDLPNMIVAGVRTSDQSTHAVREIMTILAGPAAERIHSGDPIDVRDPTAASDFDRAVQWSAQITSSPSQAAGLLRAANRHVETWLRTDRVWAAVAALADELDAHEELDADAVDQTLSFWLERG